MTQRQAKLGMALFLASESVFFFMLILAFVIFRSVSIKEAAETLNFPWTSISTLCLIGSGLTVWRGARIAGRADGGSPRLWLAGTILLGSVFLFGQGVEYLRLLHRGVTVRQNLFGTTVFTLTGIHALHVFIGIILLATMLTTTRPVAVRMVAAFWLFVGGVWIVIFSVVYLWTFL